MCRPIVSLVSKKWQQIIKSFNDDLNLVHTYSAKIAYGYCDSSQLDRHAFCLCSNTDIYHVDPFIKLVVDNISFKELYLFIPPNFRYCASPGILDSKFLTILHIKGKCNMNIIQKINVMPSLKELYFHSICIFSHAFSNFIPKCPLLVLLTLINCDNLNELTVPHLNYLEKLHFHLCCPAFTKLDLSASTKLQLLHIDSTNVPDSFPHDICSTFPSLKSLCLILCRGLKKIKIVSPLLESLTLNNIIDLDEAFIATPNLQLFNVIYSFKFQTLTFAENLGENITLSLETDATGAKGGTFQPGNLEPLCIMRVNLVLMNELEGWNRDDTKCYKCSEYMFWYSAVKLFIVLESTAFARQEREARCDKSTLCVGSGERESRNGRRPLYAGSEEGREQQCILFVALPNLSTITREGAHQINLEFE
ncbi:hypothetical protein H5410_023064, partial [Solanum commersonii]